MCVTEQAVRAVDPGPCFLLAHGDLPSIPVPARATHSAQKFINHVHFEPTRAPSLCCLQYNVRVTLLVTERGDSEVMNTGIYCRCLTVNSLVLEDVRTVAIEVKCSICSVESIRLLFWL